jgi:hypothetical protein
MTFTFKLARRIARFRAPLAAAAVLTLAGCDSDNAFSPEQPAVLDPASPSTPAAFAGGIPIGFFAHPTTMFNARYNGGHQVISENAMLRELTEIKSRGGRVVLSLSGAPKYYLENGRFSFTKWKERINRYRGINFSSFIADGTVIGHFMIDEPNDPANWNGQAVSPAMLEEMGKYSKQLWPEMPTIVRVEPEYLDKGQRYVDAAWAQYLYRRGDADEYIRRNVADAQERGLALVVGMNVLKGGNPTGTRMSASEVQSWGSALLSSTYPCAFISWEYDANFLSTSGMGAAMDELRRKAENRSTRSCRRTSGGTTTPPPPPPDPDPEPDPEPPSTSQGLLFGPYGAPMSQFGSYSGAIRVVTPTNVVANLQAARQSGAKVILRLTAGDLQNSNGTFSLTKWKAAIDRYARVDLSSFVRDGTFAGHLLIHSPDEAGRWGGQRISHATLDEMARYSRSRWGAVPTIVEADASWLATTTTWSWLDGVWAIYSGASGDPATWVGHQASAAGRARLGIMLGMNVLNGGTSASGIRGTQDGKYAMSVTQLRNWGATLIADSRACGFGLQRYDSGYFGRTDIAGALAELGRKAESRQATSCRKR